MIPFSTHKMSYVQFCEFLAKLPVKDVRVLQNLAREQAKHLLRQEQAMSEASGTFSVIEENQPLEEL